ncbi:MAG: hypothetical protein ACRC6F_03545 [Aeromonas sp.]
MTRAAKPRCCQAALLPSRAAAKPRCCQAALLPSRAAAKPKDSAFC